MGCDIHSMLEVRTEVDEDGEATVPYWRHVTEGVFAYPYRYPKDAPTSISNPIAWSTPLSGRNYRLFAMLADVRNGRGFAGVDTGDRVEPIAEPRGVPADASADWLNYVSSWGEDLHSTSYFTLAELLAYDWDGLIFQRGYINESEYIGLRGTENTPTSWSGDIWGANLIKLTAAEYEALSTEKLDELRGGPVVPATRTYDHERIVVQHQWATLKRDSMGDLVEAIEVMKASAPKTWSPEASAYTEPRQEDIRIVFGFDN